MRKFPGAGRSSRARRAAQASLAPSWAAILAVVFTALGCGSPFMGLAPPEDTPEPDASPRDVSAQDAPQTTPDVDPDHQLEDATRDGSKAPDSSTGSDAHHDGALDAIRPHDAGDGARPNDRVDGSIIADAPGARESGADVLADRKTNDAPFDGAKADANSDASPDERIDAAADAGSDASPDTDIDASTADGDVQTDANDGPVCGFAPPAPGGTCPAVCNDGCIDGICQIACRGEQECKGATIQCPVGFTCEINCAGKQSCDTAVVVCPDTYACRLVCAGEQSCKALESNCGSGPCQLSCQGNSQACDSAVVNCGAEACTASCTSPENLPTLNCGASCDCRPCL